MANIECGDFMRSFQIGKNMYEISFCFSDDKYSKEHMIGYKDKFKQEKPYWIGVCDVINGCEFSSAEELLKAKVFGGKSMLDRWDEIIFLDVNGITAAMWNKRFHL